MTAAPIRELLRTMPYVPFDLHLANGQVVHVQHPDFASLPPAGRLLIVWRPDCEGFQMIDLLLVNNIVVETTKQTPA